MRIGYDAKRIFHNWRGLGNYSRDLVLGVKAYSPSSECILFTPEYNDQRAVDFEKRNGPFKVVRPGGLISKLFPSLWRRNLGNICAEENIDLFHGLSHEIPYGLRRRGIKSIVTIHDLIFLRYPEYFQWVDRKVYLSKIKHAVKQADCIIAICEQTKNDLVEFLNVCPEKIEVCYQTCHADFQQGPSSRNKVDDVKHRYGLQKDYFLYVGALEERKNILNLIEAFSYFGTSRDLVIVGRNNLYKHQIEQKVRSCNLDNNVHILNSVPGEDLHPLYSGAEIFCFPSFFEGFGIPIVEALFSETPVITSTGSCFPEVGGEGAVYVNPNSPYQIAKAMYQITTDDELRARLIVGAREQSKKFTTENASKRILDVYDMVLSKS